MGVSVKKYVAAFAVVLVLIGAAAGWWLFGRQDALAQANAYLAKGDVAAATVALRAAVRDNPDNPDAHLHLAELQLHGGDGIAAEREARAAIQLRPGDAKATMILAQAYLAQGKAKELLSEFPASSVPADVRANLLILRASADLALNDASAAASEAGAAQALAPNSADPALMLARVAVSRGDLTEADHQIDRALSTDPKRVDALVLKAQLLLRKGDRPGALARLDQAIEAAPRNEGLLVQRAQLMIETNQDAKARTDVDAALKIAGRDLMPAYLNAVLLTRAGKYAEADPEYGKLSTVISRLPRGYFFLGLNKLGLNQTEQGLDAAERFNARAPNDPVGRNLLAQAMIANRQPDRAIALLNDAVGKGQNDAETQDLLGRAYAVSGQARQAEQKFAAASQLAPDNTRVLARLAAARMVLGDASGASSALERSLEVSPNQAGVNESLVAAQIAAGNTTAAAESLAKLRAQTGDTETTGNLQGMLNIAGGNPEGALANFAATAAKFPNSTAARLNQARLLVLLGRPGEAEPLFSDVLAKEPANGQALGPMIGRYVQTGRIDAAIGLVQSALKAQPTNVALQATLSDLLVRTGKPKEALATTDDAVRNGGQPPVGILAARARALGADGQTALAQASYNQILRANPGDIEARRQLIDLLANAADYDTAKTVTRDGLKIAPGDQALLDTLLRIEFKANGINGALKLADELRADPANMPAAATLKADALILAGRNADALAAYKAAYAQTPSSELALRAAATDAALGHPDDGAAILRTWTKGHPDDLAATRQLAQLDLAANRLPDAQREFEAVLAGQPRDTLTLNNLAWIYQQANDPRAKPTALAAYTQQPTADTADTLGWIMTTTGDPAGGLPLLRQSDALRPNTPTVRYHLAVALNATGQKADAVNVLDPLLSGNPTFPERADAQKLLSQLRAN